MQDTSKRILHRAVASIFLFASSASAIASTIAPVKVATLFKEADLVAIVKIVSGDSEHYPTTVYKAEVLTAFKGTATGERFFFGPFGGMKVGGEYLAFLRKSNNSVAPKDSTAGVNYGFLPSFYQIMYEGFSILEIDYACVFDGNDIAQKCDYGVELNPEQVILPNKIKTFPVGPADAVTNYKKWVRRTAVITLLEQVKRAKS